MDQEKLQELKVFLRSPLHTTLYTTSRIVPNDARHIRGVETENLLIYRIFTDWGGNLQSQSENVLPFPKPNLGVCGGVLGFILKALHQALKGRPWNNLRPLFSEQRNFRYLLEGLEGFTGRAVALGIVNAHQAADKVLERFANQGGPMSPANFAVCVVLELPRNEAG